MNIKKSSVYEILEKNRNSNANFFYEKNDNSFKLNYKEFFQLVDDFSEYLYLLGIKKSDKIGIMLENSIEWMIIDLSCMKIGAITVPININYGKEEIDSIIEDSKIKLLFTRTRYEFKNNIIIEKSMFIQDFLKKVFIKKNKVKKTPRIVSEDIATICYTSGSTGKPKGVILTNKNLAYVITNQPFEFSSKDLLISYLPLTHMYERTCNFYPSIYNEISVVIAENPKKLNDLINIYKPTALITVPYVIEKIYQGMLNNKFLRPLLRFNLNFIVERIIKKKLGGQLRFFICGGAKIDIEILKFFFRLNIPIYQGYGLTEFSPLVSSNFPGNNLIGSVGKPLKGTEVKISEHGTLLIKGPGFMKDYTKNKEKDRKMDGVWFDSNDLAHVEDGYIFIDGRKDDLIIMSNGKKVYPEWIEKKIELKGIENAFIYGEGKSYLSALIYSKKNFIEVKKIIDGLNIKIAKHERIKRFKMISEPFSYENKTLTNTLKKKRDFIKEKHLDEINSLYMEND